MRARIVGLVSTGGGNSHGKHPIVPHPGHVVTASNLRTGYDDATGPVT